MALVTLINLRPNSLPNNKYISIYIENFIGQLVCWANSFSQPQPNGFLVKISQIPDTSQTLNSWICLCLCRSVCYDYGWTEIFSVKVEGT